MERRNSGATQLKILFVDDMEDDVLLFVRYLSHHGITTTWKRTDTAEALLALLHEESFDLAIVDYVMPTLTGLEAIKLVHDQQPTLPIIATSGIVKEEAIVETLRAGANDYILKDNLTRLLPAIDRALGDARAARRAERLASYQVVTREVLGCLNRVAHSDELVQEIADILAGMLPVDAVEVRPSHSAPDSFHSASHPEQFKGKDFHLFATQNGEKQPSPLPRFTDMGTVWTGTDSTGVSTIPNMPRDEAGNAYGGFAKIPIRSVDSKVAGFLVFASKEGGIIDGEFIALAETLSVSISSGLERIRGRKQLREAAQQWRATIDSIGSPLFLLDAGLRITRCNRSFANLVSKTFEEIIGHHCWAVVHGTSAPVEGCPFLVMQGTLQRASTEIELDRRCFNVTTDPLLDDDGVIAGAVAVMNDVTEVKLSAVGRLAGGVAHDFNNLLTGIGAFTDFGLEDVEEGGQGHESLQEIRRLTDSASALTRQLLSFSRKSPSEFREVNLNKLLRTRQNMLSRFLGESIELAFELGDRVWPIRGDCGQLEQVLVNLCINARDAMPNGGKLTIETFVKTLRGDHIGAQMTIPPGDYVCLMVCDTGTGMTDAVIQRIFDPFYSTKAINRGTGLGLATVKSIIDGHEGSVDVYSELNRGTSFKIYLPRYEGVQPLQPSTDDSKLEIPTGVGRVMLVEDNTTIRTVVTRVLRDNGFHVTACARPEVALETMQNEEPYHLLVTDIVLPGIPGDELAVKAAKLQPNLRFLFLSGYTDSVLKREGVALLSTDFLAKPFSPRELLVMVHSILEQF